MTAWATTPQRVIGVAAGGVVVLVVLWWLLLWGPREKAYSQARANAQSAAANVQSLQAQLSQLRSAQTQSGQANQQKQLATEEAAIPSSPQLAQVILGINSAAETSGVNFLGISPSQPSTTGPASAAPYPINVTLTINGGYYQLLDFINRIESLPRLVVISGLDISGGSSGGAELNVSVTAKIFTSKPYSASLSTTTTTTTTTTAPATGTAPTSGTAPTTTTTAAP
jgi:Tfp pilus assembly protein PilO